MILPYGRPYEPSALEKCLAFVLFFSSLAQTGRLFVPCNCCPPCLSFVSFFFFCALRAHALPCAQRYGLSGEQVVLRRNTPAFVFSALTDALVKTPRVSSRALAEKFSAPLGSRDGLRAAVVVLKRQRQIFLRHWRAIATPVALLPLLTPSRLEWRRLFQGVVSTL